MYSSKRIVIIGRKGVGKSTLLNQFINRWPQAPQCTTHEGNYSQLTLKLDVKNRELKPLVEPGYTGLKVELINFHANKFRQMRASESVDMLKSAAAILLVFDPSNSDCWSNLKNGVDYIKNTGFFRESLFFMQFK